MKVDKTKHSGVVGDTSNEGMGLAFKVYKEGHKDADGNQLIAEAEFGFFGGPLAGISVQGFTIKSHPVRGMQVALPEHMECYVPERWEDVERRILMTFAKEFLQAASGKTPTIKPGQSPAHADCPCDDPCEEWGGTNDPGGVPPGESIH